MKKNKYIYIYTYDNNNKGGLLRASSHFEVLCTSMLVNVLTIDTVADVGDQNGGGGAA
jgi:hypothetical protein